MGFLEGFFGRGSEGNDEREGAGHIANPNRGMDPDTDQISRTEINSLLAEYNELKANPDRTTEENKRMNEIDTKLYNAGVSHE